MILPTANLNQARPSPGSRALVGLMLLLATGAAPARAQDVPVFEVRTASGLKVSGPLLKLTADWTVRVGKGVGRRVNGAEVLSVRRQGLPGPAFPTDEHLILVNGDRVPVKGLRLHNERLRFRHPDLEGGAETSLPLAAVAVFWRTAPEKTAAPEKFRRRLAGGSRTRDTVLLRNGDVLRGVLNGLDDKAVEVEVAKKGVSAKINQVAAVALSTDLTDALRPKGTSARLVLTESDRSPGGRLTLTAATSDGKYLRGKTAFGAHLRVPLARVAALDLFGGKAVYLSDLKPSRYEYRPFLDEHWPWSADASVTGRDLRVGGAVFDKGLGMHSHSRLTYQLDGAYRRLEALVGLDDLDGRRGSVRLRVLGDGKPLRLGAPGEVTHAGGPLPLSVKVEGVKELTLEVLWGGDGPVQGVVNWADARLVK
jgi:hypothetical protein